MKPNPTLKNRYQRKKCYVWVRMPLKSDITLVTVGDINISRNAIGFFKTSQGCFRREEMRITYS